MTVTLRESYLESTRTFTCTITLKGHPRSNKFTMTIGNLQLHPRIPVYEDCEDLSKMVFTVLVGGTGK